MDLRKLCRLCFTDNAQVDITEHRASACPELTILELLQAMYGENLMMDLAQQLPMICSACMDECLLQYGFFRKLRTANQQLLKLYQEAQVEACPVKETRENDPLLIPQEGDSLIVSEFLPSTVTLDPNPGQQMPEIRTVDYAAVELKRHNLQEYNEANRLLDTEPSGSQTVYKCQYCPQAYASPEYLKTHVRSSHVCKYCTMAFGKVRDLNEHIRSNHADHQCAVCSHNFSSGSNLRAHLKRVHCVQLPAQVSLLDYKPGPK
ncbi:hypothetical protein KR018_005963 [Drosophila ironensis]|nr:hypothetical protein KR018_005963 [Drosophila ironensis]